MVSITVAPPIPRSIQPVIRSSKRSSFSITAKRRYTVIQPYGKRVDGLADAVLMKDCTVFNDFNLFNQEIGIFGLFDGT